MPCRRECAKTGICFCGAISTLCEVLAVRDEITRRLAGLGLLDENHPVIEAIGKPGVGVPGMEPLTTDNAPLRKLLYSGRMIALYERLLGGPIRHYDFTWFRAMPGGGQGTYPHCDVVYMGRGTRNLFTAWTPLWRRADGGWRTDDFGKLAPTGKQVEAVS